MKRKQQPKPQPVQPAQPAIALEDYVVVRMIAGAKRIANEAARLAETLRVATPLTAKRKR